MVREREGLAADLEQLKAMMENPEPLDPELQEYLDGEVEGMLVHPLVTMPYFSTVHASIANRYLRAKREMLAAAEAEEDWGQVTMLYERHARLLAFVERQHLMEAAEYWELLGTIWIDAEFPSTDQFLWLELFKAPRADREHLMSEEERAELAEMPQDLVIYRGTNGSHANLQGMSWTLSRNLAAWFAERFRYECPIVAEGRCQKSRVLAYFTRRGEDEIVIDPKDIRELRETQL